MCVPSTTAKTWLATSVRSGTLVSLSTWTIADWVTVEAEIRWCVSFVDRSSGISCRRRRIETITPFDNWTNFKLGRTFSKCLSMYVHAKRASASSWRTTTNGWRTTYDAHGELHDPHCLQAMTCRLCMIRYGPLGIARGPSRVRRSARMKLAPGSIPRTVRRGITSGPNSASTL